MARVADMLTAPASESAMDTAHRMRALMSMDLDEFELADQVVAMNERLNMDANLFHQAWGILASNERRAWKAFLTLRRDREREHDGY